MGLIKCTEPEAGVATTGLLWGATWVELTGDQLADRAVLAYNINVLRREAPFLYLICSGFSSAIWPSEDIGDSIDNAYARSLEHFDLRKRLCISYPNNDSEGSTVVLSLGSGDVGPFVHLLEHEEFGLLALRVPQSPESFRDAVSTGRPGDGFLNTVLMDGGWAMSAIDMVRYRIWTLDPTVIDYVRQIAQAK